MVLLLASQAVFLQRNFRASGRLAHFQLERWLSFDWKSGSLSRGNSTRVFSLFFTKVVFYLPLNKSLKYIGQFASRPFFLTL